MSKKQENGGVRPARRTTKSEPSNWASKGVALEPDAYTVLMLHAKRLGMHGSTFASAAIRYFTENMLDPTKASGVPEGVTTRTILGESIYKMRQEQVKTGNHLVQLMGEYEIRQRAVLQAHEEIMATYLEAIETNILAQLDGIGSQILAPLLEQIVRGNTETRIARRMIHRLQVELKKDHLNPISEAVESDNTIRVDKRREELLEQEIGKLITAMSMASAQPTPKPAAIAIASILPVATVSTSSTPKT